MRKYFFICCLVLCFSLNACQCSNKPEIGPVEGTRLVALP